MRPSAAASRQIISETTITETLLATLRDDFPDNVTVEMFTQAQETANGADWFWRIEHGDRSMNAMVQAKRIRRPAFNTTDERADVIINQPQLQMLVNSAARSDIPNLQTWLMTYGRCKATPPCGEDPARCTKHCGHSPCSPLDRDASIWVAKATDLSRFGDSVPFADIVKTSVRLDCQLPCSIDGQSPGPIDKGFQLVRSDRTFEEITAVLRERYGLRGAILIRS